MLAAIPGLLHSATLAGGDDGTEQTVALLRRLVDDAWKDPVVNRAAIEIIRAAGIAPYDSVGQVNAIYDFARSFYFVNDPVSKEALRPTRELLLLRAGDCDDINANVLPALLGTIGYESRLVTIAADPVTPDLFSHVYAEVNLDGQWIPLDAARPGAVFGVGPAYFFRRKWWSLVDGSSADYPAGAPNAADSGCRGVRGLGAVSAPASDLSIVGSALQSISGQLVQAATGTALGPGGATVVAPPATPAVPSSATMMEDLLLLGVAAAVIWWMVS